MLTKLNKKSFCITLLLLSSIALAGCGDNGDNSNGNASSSTVSTSTAAAPSNVQNKDSKTLIAYFSYVDNTDADNIKSDQYDVMSSASLLIRNNQRIGVNRVMAEEMGKITGGDVFSIQTANKYPANYDETTKLGKDERDKNIKPELKDSLADTSQYENVILVIPVWWYDVPMAFETFLTKTNLAGKKIYVTGSSGGSTLNSSFDTVKRLVPNAASVEKGVFLVKSDTKNPEPKVDEWLKSVGLAK